MRRFGAAILGVVAPIVMMTASGSPSAWAQDVSHLNQDMDNRPNLQAEPAVGGHTSNPGVDVQGPLPTSTPKFRSKSKRRVRRTSGKARFLQGPG